MNMNKSYFLRLLSFLILTSSLSTRAEDSLRSRRGLFPYLGIGLGLQTLSTDISGEVPKKGFNWGPRVIGSYYTQNWALDLGLGYNMGRISGTNSTTIVKVNTDSAWLEIAPRYRASEFFQIGPAFSLMMGTDESYSETVGTKGSLMMIGAHALFDLPSDGPLMRTGLLALKGLGLDRRSTFLVMADFQIGFDLFGNLHKRMPPPAPVLPPPAPVLPIETPTVEIAQVVDLESVLVRFPEDRLLFDFKMSHLHPERRAYLAEFAKFLAANPGTWESVVITGHTDNRGTDRVNDELSNARAKTVFDVLLSEKVSRERMSYKGMGMRVPLDPASNEEAWRLNRRVELEFRGVTNPKLFSGQLNRIDSERKF